MTPSFFDADDLVALGAFAGAQVLVVIFSVMKANAYRERGYLMHAAATLLAVMLVQTLTGTNPMFPQSVMLLVMAFSGLHLRDLLSHGGALRQLRKWLLVLCLGVVPVLAVVSAFQAMAMLAGVAAWSIVSWLVMQRAWRMGKPWIWWLLPGMLALTAAGVLLGWRAVNEESAAALPIAGLLALWTACVFFASDWRGRIFSETRARIDARNTVDPLTGLAMPMVLTERINAARSMMLRYGHPSVLLLIHIEQLGRIASEYGPEAAEAAVLASANRVRQSLRDGDVAARLSYSRFAVLAEGLAAPEGASVVASRILVAGLKEPLPSMPAEFLHFRMVLAAVPPEDIPPKQLLQRLASRMDQELKAPTERRIVTLPSEEFAPSVPAVS
ncbi:MAG: diguanylate cyclase [Burkholderiales bacterium]|nr:diguanylate cyclase [Burkholderiales bacterium]